MRQCWLTRSLLLLAIASALPAAAEAATAYLKIDGRYYLIDQVADAISYSQATSLWEIKAAAVNNCRRSNGLPPQLGVQGFIAIPSYTVIYTSSAAIDVDHVDPIVITVSTPSGDVICDGAVAGPPPSTGIFSNGFE